MLAVAMLETPGNATDGLDNDGDGLVDESRTDGIDNDGDWNPDSDDLGEDGLANTNDAGEGDGAPTPGEPNFDELDVDESDQVGLTISLPPRKPMRHAPSVRVLGIELTATAANDATAARMSDSFSWSVHSTWLSTCASCL